jgi:hypothetical protein
VTVAHAFFAIAAGKTASVPLALNATGRKLLSGSYTLHATLTFTGVTIPAEAITYSYPLVTADPPVAWVVWTWHTQCSVCWTSVYHHFTIPGLLKTATVHVTCTGGHCPASASFGPGKTSVNLAPLFANRRFLPGVVIKLVISAPRSIARVITWTVQAQSAPKRSALCLPPGDTKPGRCAK